MEGRSTNALGRAFRLSLDRLGITRNARKRRRVGREVAKLAGAPLPGPGDYETLVPHRAGVAWVREISELRVWVLYRFDEGELEVLVLVETRPAPIPAEDE